MNGNTQWYNERVERFVSDREEVSNGQYALLVFLMLCLALGNAAMNGFYGSEQAATWGKILLTTSLFFVGDLVLITLAHYLFPRKWTNGFAAFALVGFAALSMFSATAFLIGQQYEKDNPQISLINDEINDIKSERDDYPEGGKRALRQRLSELNDQRRQTIDEQTEAGTYMTGATAVYHYIAKVIGAEVETVSLMVRMLWSLVFVTGSMALGGMLNTMYSPRQLDRYSRHLTDRTRTEIAGAVRYDRETKTDNVRTITNEPYQHRVGTVQSGGTVNNELYLKVKQMIVNGELTPSVRQVKPVVGSTDVAAQYLRDLADEGVLNKHPSGYKLAV